MYIRMGITIFKIFFLGGISGYIQSEIMFYINKIFDHIYDDIPPQMKILNTVIPLVYIQLQYTYMVMVGDGFYSSTCQCI